MTTKKVMKIHEFEDAIYYRAACNCGDTKCDMTIELEIDKDIQMITMTLYKDVYWSSFWKSDNFFFNIWERIKCALRVLFNGYIEMEEAFIFQGDGQIDAFLSAIEEGRDYLKK
jgi:hypothetical protein